MTPFDKHGITHLSASSINHFISEPAHWVMTRLLGKWSDVGAAALRGSAVEDGVNAGLFNSWLPVSECAKIARKSFHKRSFLNVDEKCLHELNNIDKYVEYALEEIRQYGEPASWQERIEIRIDGVEVPIIGFTDWRYDHHKLILDLKTTERMPSKIMDGHARQGAIYAMAFPGHDVRFVYTKPSKTKATSRAVNVYPLTAAEVTQQFKAISQVAVRIRNFLSISTDAHELAGILAPNFESYWWNNKEARSLGAETYGY